jgi:C1A family cysteine protease
MADFKVGGYRREPDSDKHLSYEAILAPKMGSPPPGDIDLRPFTSPRHNQRQTSSCVAQSVIKALEIKRIQKFGHTAHVDLSIMALYYLARELMTPNETGKDEGTFVSKACDILHRFGVCEEAEWPFQESRLFVPPTWGAMRHAYVHKISLFYKIMSTGQKRVTEVANAIRAGNPVVYGTLVGDQWNSYDKGDILVPPDNPGGGHATCLVGVQGKNFIGENSWSENWGDNGFYLMSPDVIADKDLSSDFWVITTPWDEVQ